MHSKHTKLRARLAAGLHGRILDCGSGDDLYAAILRRGDNEVVSLDIDFEALAAGRPPAVAGSCARLPFADDAFDAVWACALIEHVREDAVPEMIRVTRPGGRIVIVTPNRHSPFDAMKRILGLTAWDENEGHVRLYDYEALRPYGRVHGETWFVPFGGWFFWRYPRLAHVLVQEVCVTPSLKARVRAAGGGHEARKMSPMRSCPGRP